MSKHKPSKKKLIIEDDEPQVGEELNPFSFKEFIRSKTQYSSTTGEPEKTSATCQAENDFDYPGGFDHCHKGTFFTDPSLLDQSFPNKHENDWIESFQNLTSEEAHGLSRTLESSAYLDHSLLSSDTKDETMDDWELGDEFSPETPFNRRSTGSYEGDEETSVVDLTFHSKKSSVDNGIRGQQKLREENAELRKHIRALIKKSEENSTKIKQLTDELKNRKLQEEREAKALEAMVQSVEQNLELMTKRAVKAENSLTKVKQEFQQLQSQLEGYKCENERLRAGESAAVNTMRHNAQMASEYLHKAAQDAETSIKQLLTGRETLCLVSDLLRSIDKLTEVQK